MRNDESTRLADSILFNYKISTPTGSLPVYASISSPRRCGIARYFSFSLKRIRARHFFPAAEFSPFEFVSNKLAKRGKRGRAKINVSQFAKFVR